MFPHDDRPHEECGVIGVFAPNEDVARMTFFGLYALQHRGQEAAGIAVADGQSISMYKGVGLVSQVFTAATMAELKGHYAIGHTRYSTTGSSLLRNAQPFMIETINGPLALAHNGNLVNDNTIRAELELSGSIFASTMDSEVIVHLLDLFPPDNSDPAENYKTIRRELEAFSPNLAAKHEIIAANKLDLAIDDEALDKLMEALPDKEIFAISGATRQGVENLLETLWKNLHEPTEDTPPQ